MLNPIICFLYTDGLRADCDVIAGELDRISVSEVKIGSYHGADVE